MQRKIGNGRIVTRRGSRSNSRSLSAIDLKGEGAFLDDVVKADRKNSIEFVLYQILSTHKNKIIDRNTFSSPWVDIGSLCSYSKDSIVFLNFSRST